MQKRSRTKYSILGMLSIKSFTGYEIIKMIQGSTNYFWSESEGQIYPTLAQCVTEGLATCKERASKKNSREKKVYTITPNGKIELNNWLKKSPQPTLVRNELLLKLFFGKQTAKRDNIHHILQRQNEITEELTTYKKLHSQLQTKHANSPHLKYWLITLDYGIKTSTAELAWCKQTLKILESESS